MEDLKYIETQDVFDYLVERDVQRFEPLKFGFWKRIIKYKTKKSNYESRKIFTKLLDDGYFWKFRINNKHFKYRFVPFGEIEKREFPIIMTW